MTRLQFVLLSLLIMSALSLVVAQQEARRMFLAVHKSANEQKALQDEWSKLRLLQTSTVKPAYIDQQAHQHLNMQSVTPARTFYVDMSLAKPVIQESADVPSNAAEVKP